MSSDYSHVVREGLKLKKEGKSLFGKKTKSKKRKAAEALTKSSTSETTTSVKKEPDVPKVSKDGNSGADSDTAPSITPGPQPESSSSKATKKLKTIPEPTGLVRVSEKTEAEKKFEEIQSKRRRERIAKIASKSHKERVADLNNYLGGLTEHYDIPKVGPG